MYAAPSDAEFFNGNGTYANHGGNIGNQAGIVGNFGSGVRLPAFNASFIQTPLNSAVDSYGLDAVALRYAQNHQAFRDLQHKQSVQQHLQEYSASHGNGSQIQEHPIVQSVFVAGKYDNRPYSGYAVGSSRPGPSMARLPTIPASSLVRHDSQHPTVDRRQIPDSTSASFGIQPHQSATKDQAAVRWNNQPPYNNVVISRSSGEMKAETRHGMESSYLNGIHIDTDQKFPISYQAAASESTRTVDEKEAAVILAGFASPSNPSIPLRQPKSEVGPNCDNRQAILQRQQQIIKTTPVLQGATAAATAENIVRFTQLQKQHQFYSPMMQNGVPSPVSHPVGNVRHISDGIRATNATVLQQQYHHVEANPISQSTFAAPKPMRTDDMLLRHLSERATLEKRSVINGALLYPEQRPRLQNSGPQQRFPAPVGYQPSDSHAIQAFKHHQQQQQQQQHHHMSTDGRIPAVSSSSSSAISELLITEFIRQMEPAANGGVQDGWHQQQQPAITGTAPEQRQTNDIRQSGVVFSPKVLQHNGQPTSSETKPQHPPSTPIHTQQLQFIDACMANGQHPTFGQKTVIVTQHRPDLIQRRLPTEHQIKEESPGLANVPVDRAPSNNQFANCASSVGVQCGQELQPKSRPVQMANGQNHSDRSSSVEVHPPAMNMKMKVEQVISNGHIAGKTTDLRLSVVQDGRVSKKRTPLTVAKKKGVKALAKPTKAMIKSEKPINDGELPIGEFQLPNVKEDPLSLSMIGLMSRLANNSSRANQVAKKQRRQKDAKSTFLEKLPAMFGPVAASLSLSNGATTKLLGVNTASNASSATEDQPRPTGPVTSDGKKHVYAKITLKQELGTFTSDRIMLPDGTLESEESLKHRLDNNITQPVHKCSCLPLVDEDVEGPYYTHLAAATSVKMMRSLLEERYGAKGDAIRIEKVRFTNKEGKTPDGCPIAKWVIRRSGWHEKILCVVRQRPHHFCSTAVIAICIVIWDGVEYRQADSLYNFLVDVLPNYGVTTNRRCETNEKRLCACQGVNERIGGASFSFGCSWSMYSNTCKFCKSRGDARKFKLLPDASSELESKLEEKCHKLADAVAPVFKRMAPACHRNQTYYSERAQACRLGDVPRGPFSGITACVDFCAHAHKDIHNMNNGCTVVVTLTKHRGLEKPDDEQLHVLPLCVLDSTDEFGSQENQWKKTQTGSLEMLGTYPMNLRLRRNPLPCCKERTKQLKQRPGRPMKSKQPRLETRTPELPQTIPGVSNWPNFSSINGIANQPVANGAPLAPSVNGNGEQTQRLPSMDTFSQFNSARMQAEQKANMFQYSSGPFYLNGSTTPPTSSSQPLKAYDLAGLAQGFRTPSPMVSRDGEGGDCDQDGSIYVTYTDNREAFTDPSMGGVAIALSHGSVLLEVAKRELHATTALKTPDRRDPKRISLVFYQHKHMDYANHGAEELEKKVAAKNGLMEMKPSAEGDSDDEPGGGGTKDGKKSRMEEQWPDLPPLKMDGDWRGTPDLCMSLVTDKVVVSSEKMKRDQKNPTTVTQKYIRQVPSVRVMERKVSK